MSATAYTWQAARLYKSAFECIKKYDGKESSFYKKVRADYNSQRLFITLGLLCWVLSGIVFLALNEEVAFGSSQVSIWDYTFPSVWLGTMFAICIYPYYTKRHFKEINGFIGWYKKFYDKRNPVTKRDYENFKKSLK